jgi:hypothetical protein
MNIKQKAKKILLVLVFMIVFVAGGLFLTQIHAGEDASKWQPIQTYENVTNLDEL